VITYETKTFLKKASIACTVPISQQYNN